MNLFGLSFVLFILKWSAGKAFYLSPVFLKMCHRPKQIDYLMIPPHFKAFFASLPLCWFFEIPIPSRQRGEGNYASGLLSVSFQLILCQEIYKWYVLMRIVSRLCADVSNLKYRDGKIFLLKLWSECKNLVENIPCDFEDIDM